MPDELDNFILKNTNSRQEIDKFFKANGGEVSPAKRRAERAARTEVRRGERTVRSLGLEDELKPEQTTLDTVFDLLQIGQFTTAGLAKEYQAGGGLDDIVLQAGSEFLNALPFISEENAEAVTGKTPTRPSFSQVLKNEGVGNEWAAAAGGLALDVALDPTTYVGGFLFKGAARAIGKAGRALAESSETVAKVENLLGRAYVPGFELKQMVKSGEITQEGADAYKAAIQAKDAAIQNGAEDVRDISVLLSGNLDEGSRRLMGEFFDQGDVALRKQLTDGLPADEADAVMERVGEFRKFFQKDFDNSFKAGLLDETQERLHYIPGRLPQTGASESAWRNLVKDRGISERAAEGVSGGDGLSGLAGRLGIRDPNFTKGKVFNHLEERIRAGVPTETDIAVLAATKGFETVRAIASKNFGEAVLKNGDIAKALQPDDLSLLNSQEFLSGFGEKGWVPFNLSKKSVITKPTEIAAGDAVYMMPKTVVKDLEKANKPFTDTEVATQLFDKFKDVQNLWKGYAVLSPGFHGRNMFSNVFNNWVGGVSNPKHYKDALQLQRQTFTGKIAGESADEFMAKARDLGVVNRGFVAGDIAESVERDLLRDVQGRTFNSTIGQGSPQLRANRALGRAVENNARLAHYVAKRKEGLTAAEAATSVKKYLFDYQELTDFERNVMKSAIPFYTWMRKNVPLQVHAMVNNSGDVINAARRGGARAAGKDVMTQYRNVPKLFDAIQSISEDWGQVPIPDYFQEIHAVRLPVEGEPGVANVFANPNLPFQDLNRLNWRDVLSSTSPVLRLPIELSIGEQGHSFFLDRPIERFPGEEGVTGLPRKVEFAAEGLIPFPVGKGLRLFKNFQRDNLTAPLVSEATGFKTITLDPGRASRSDIFARRAQVRDILSRERNAGRLR